MLTVDFAQFDVAETDRVLDLGCGAGRHTFEAYRRGAHVVALDYSADEVRGVSTMLAAIASVEELPPEAKAAAIRGDAFNLPFTDNTFDRVVAAEVLEHLPADDRAMAEIVRVVRPGGLVAVTVPRWLPEKICWELSTGYHSVEGGHVRIYKENELRARLVAAGLEFVGRHYAHSLHAPYWWLRCLVGVHDDDHPATKLYHRMLVWDMMRRPWQTRLAERALDPLIGKSVVLYLRKPPTTATRTAATSTADGSTVAASTDNSEPEVHSAGG